MGIHVSCKWLFVSILQILEIGLGIANCLFREVDRLTVVLGRKEETKYLPIKSFKGIVYRNEVTQGLRHFDIVDIDKAIVHPVVSKSLACFSFRLGNFIGVVWKL
ncbi:Uncharacterised protein [Streptococcus pneumoniae]|nr:Uncharacterised protein [Streptococcus pneumoniae]CIV68479.1 Uncharacterised protein [Streptococcus pneumoniae]